MIIAISRENGSGGSEIGHKLADKLGIPCYDKTVTALTADISGFAKDMVERAADKTPMAFDYSGYYYFYDAANSEKWLPVYDQIYLAQSKAILRLAARGRDEGAGVDDIKVRLVRIERQRAAGGQQRPRNHLGIDQILITAERYKHNLHVLILLRQ